MPPYTTYISAKRNVLVEDDKNSTFLPYLGEQFSIDIADEDYKALENKIEDNRRNYHLTNRINEKAFLHAPITRDFLKDAGCTAHSVLEYLLNEEETSPPSELPNELLELWSKRTDYLQEDYYERQDDSDAKEGILNHEQKPKRDWRLLFKEMDKRENGEELTAACIACYVFQSIAGYSLFHVVKQADLNADSQSLGSADLSEDVIAVKDDPTVPELHSLGTYAELVCQVCKA